MTAENEVAALMRRTATEIREEGALGWGNACEQAADEIDRLQAALDEARELLNRADRMLTGRISDLLPTSKVAS